jgi:hypothetical protein
MKTTKAFLPLAAILVLLGGVVLSSCTTTDHAIQLAPLPASVPVSASAFYTSGGEVVTDEDYDVVDHFQFEKTLTGPVGKEGYVSPLDVGPDVLALVKDKQADAVVNFRLIPQTYDSGNTGTVGALKIIGWMCLGFGGMFGIMNVAMPPSEYDTGPSVFAGMAIGFGAVGAGSLVATLIMEPQGKTTWHLAIEGDLVKQRRLESTASPFSDALAGSLSAGPAELPDRSPLPAADIRIDGNFNDWGPLTPAFLATGSSVAANLAIEKVYLAVDAKNLYMRFDLKDHRPTTGANTHNFDSSHNTSYGLDLVNGDAHLVVNVNYWEGRKIPWAVEVIRQAKGTWETVVSTASNLSMKEGSLEVAFPLAAIRKYLGPIAAGSYYSVVARTGYSDRQTQKWVNGDRAAPKLLTF